METEAGKAALVEDVPTGTTKSTRVTMPGGNVFLVDTNNLETVSGFGALALAM